MRLSTAHDLTDSKHGAGRGSWLFSCDVAREYCQLPLDPGDWPLVCFSEGGRYYMDVSLPFSMRWAAALCQDATSLIAHHFNSQGTHILPYINDFGGVASMKDQAQVHFHQLQAILDDLGLVEAKRKASPPSHKMTWLGLDFNVVSMTITTPLSSWQTSPLWPLTGPRGLMLTSTPCVC